MPWFGCRWMGGFVEILKYSNPSLAVEEDESEPAPVSVLQAEVVETLALYMSKYEEEFQPYLGSCLGHAWALLTRCATMRMMPRSTRTTIV